MKRDLLKALAIWRRAGAYAALERVCEVVYSRLRGWEPPGAYLANPKRLLTALFERFATERPSAGVVPVGNYYLMGDELPPGNLVYSFGVGTSIEFDLACIRQFDSRVFCFDPTARSAEFMRSREDIENLTFTREGIWVETGTLRFYFDDDARQLAKNASITNFYGQNRFFDAACRTLNDFMSASGHDCIDVLKLDIEGAALPVLEHVLTTDVRPAQVVAEFERPRQWREIWLWLRRFHRLVGRMRAEGYAVYRLRRRRRPYYGLEILFHRQSALDSSLRRDASSTTARSHPHDR